VSSTLVTPDSRPRSELRPTGTSFAGLVGVELRRLWWRRLTKAVLIGAVLFVGTAVYNAYNSSTPERVAQQLDDYKMLVDDIKRQQQEMKDQLPQMIEQCRTDEAAERERSGDQGIDFGCEQIKGPEVPTLQDIGLVPPVADAITTGIAQAGAHLLAFLAFVLGASFIGAEFTTGAMGNWLTFQPRRVRVALSKLAAAGIGAAALVGGAMLLTVLGARMVAVVNRPGDDLVLPDPDPLTDSVPQLVLRVVALAVASGILGAALGLVLRHTAAIVGVLLGYGVVVELMATQAFFQGRLRPWVLSTNIEGFLGKGTTYLAETCTQVGCEFTQHTLTYTHAWVYLLAVTSAAAVVGVLVFRRRDVT